MAGKVFRTKVHGTPELRRNLRLLGAAAIPAGKIALTEEAEATVTASKLEVPVRDGILRSTLHVAPPQVRGRTIFVQAAAGGPAAPYAVRQHEDTTLHHKVGKAKYLQDPFEARVPGLADRVAARMGGIILGAVR